MKKFFIKILAFIQRLISKILDANDGTSFDSKFKSLSPTDQVDNSKIYHNALDWALKNREAEDIKNIAITGYYGSGKSSVIKSFIKQNRHKYKFLPLSLATFKDENGPDVNSEKSIKEIEESILQQIFYKVPDEKIPDSRFSKISSRTFLKYIVFSIPIVSFFWFLLLFYIPSFNSSLGWNLSQKEIHYGFLIFGSISVLLLLWQIKDLTLRKFSVKNLEVDLAEKNNELSVLNTYIDEIIYFFKRTKYEVVVIEDIDRFETTEIFTKLREINLILNNSEITRDLNIVFIYAIKDDQFANKKDRTKFFDFILPVIPVINPNNSIDKILKISDEHQLGITIGLVKELAIYIDDMRLLLNIFNEFLIYNSQIKDVNRDKLFAIVIYKNLLPDDFALLPQGMGLLNAILDKKIDIIQNKIEELTEKVSILREENSNLEKITLNNISELRSLYILEYIKAIRSNPNYDFKFFRRDNKDLTIDDMLSDQNFKSLTENSMQYASASYGVRNFGIQFEEIEKRVSKDNTYLEREDLISKKLTNQTALNNRQIAEINLEVNDVRKSNLNEVITNQTIENTLKDYFLNSLERDNDSKKTNARLDMLLHHKLSLIQSLISNGFIDEDYFMYISIFYEERLTRKDFQYIQNVKNFRKVEYDYDLTKISEIIGYLSPRNLESEFIYNRDLTNYLLSTEDHKEERKILFNAISKGNVEALDFIAYFVNNSSFQKELIQEITSRNQTIWDEIQSSKLESNNVKFLYELILKYTDLKVLLILIEKSSLAATILNDENFLLRIENQDKLKKIISNSGLNLETINFAESDKDLLDYVYNNNHYAYTKSVILGFYKLRTKKFKPDFLKSVYSIISQDPDLVEMYNYIQNNLNSYINEIPIRINENDSEEEIYYLELLNSEEITFDNKVSLIQKMKTIISNPKKVQDINLLEYLVKEIKIQPTWSNVDYMSKEFSATTQVTKIPKNIAYYLSVKEISQTLTNQSIKEEELSIEEFETLVINRTDIPDARYEELIANFNPQDNIDLSALDMHKVKILIKKGIIQLSESNLIDFRKRFPELVLDLLEKWKEEFILETDEYNLISQELKDILKSPSFKPIEKSKILESQTAVTPDQELKTLIANLILDEKQFYAPVSIIISLIKVPLKIDRSIKLFNKISGKLTNDQVRIYLENLKEPFSKLADSSSRPSIPKDVETTKMLETLESRGIISSKRLEGQKYRIYKPTV